VDGFALQISDIAGADHASPRTLVVTADIRAGSYSGTPILSGQCARIMTGAPLPPGADAVVMVEDTDFNERFAGFRLPRRKLQVYNRFTPGEMSDAAATTCTPAIKSFSPDTLARPGSWFAGDGSACRKCRSTASPKVALLSSGDELLPVEAPLTPGKIHDANSYILAALLESRWHATYPAGVRLRYRKADVRSRLDRAVVEKADVKYLLGRCQRRCVRLRQSRRIRWRMYSGK